jgi:hypothetical protein
MDEQATAASHYPRILQAQDQPSQFTHVAGACIA